MTARENKLRNAAHFKFEDVIGDVVYKSLYLDTLGEDARRSPSPVERHYKLQQGLQDQHPSSSCEGYIHGTLSTAGIDGAAPHALARATRWRGAAAAGAADAASSCSSSDAAAGGVCRPNLLGLVPDGDPGMRPKVLIPASTNRPDLAHSTADIEGAQPYPKDVCHRPRGTNPLSPQYRLASGSGVQWPCNPQAPDRLVRNTMCVSDIPGAVPRPKTPAARAAAARAAAIAAGAAVARSSCSSSRPGVLDVADIAGATAAWRRSPKHRPVRDTCLDVSDINSFMARFKPGPRNSSEYKGHPQGPRAPSPIRPRSQPSCLDNSLRTFDIEGSSVRLAPRATHTTCLDVSDIQGARPDHTDRMQVFAAKVALSAAAAAQQQVAQAVLSGLQLSQCELMQLWTECTRRDRDRSGFLTAKELLQAMQHAQVRLPAPDAQRLVSALQDNAGLLNYRKLTRQLKGHVSRPVTAFAGSTATAAAAAAAVGSSEGPGQPSQLDQQQQQQQPLSQGPPPPRRPQTALAASRLQHSCNTTTAAAAEPQQQVGCRPSTAPARPRSAPVKGRSGSGSGHGHGKATVGGTSWTRSNREGVSIVSHWFAGSRRDATAAAAEVSHWLPGPAAAALVKGWGLNGPAPWGGIPAAAAAADGGGAAEEAAAQGAQCQGVADAGQLRDVVPAWVVGADTMHGTCRIHAPFGDMPAQAAGALGQGLPRERLLPAQGAAAAARPASACCSGFSADSPKRPMTGSNGRPQQQQRPQLHRPKSANLGNRGGCCDLVITGSSSCSVGLAERKRWLQSEEQDLQAVRMLS